MIAKVGHIIVAISLFLSSNGLILNKHFCQNELKNVALFVKAEPCHVGSSVAQCPMHAVHSASDQKESKPCCKEETELVKSTADQITSAQESRFFDVLSSLLFIPSTDLPEGTSISITSPKFLNYKPPLIVCDLPLRLQAFLC